MKAKIKATGKEVRVEPDWHEQGSYLDLDTWERYWEHQLIMNEKNERI